MQNRDFFGIHWTATSFMCVEAEVRKVIPAAKSTYGGTPVVLSVSLSGIHTKILQTEVF